MKIKIIFFTILILCIQKSVNQDLKDFCFNKKKYVIYLSSIAAISVVLKKYCFHDKKNSDENYEDTISVLFSLLPQIIEKIFL